MSSIKESKLLILFPAKHNGVLAWALRTQHGALRPQFNEALGYVLKSILIQENKNRQVRFKHVLEQVHSGFDR